MFDASLRATLAGNPEQLAQTPEMRMSTGQVRALIFSSGVGPGG